jgi:hypothetical protein
MVENDKGTVKQSNSKKYILPIIIVILLVIGVVAVVGLNVVKTPYNTKEEYIEKEPYTDRVCKDVSVPYQDVEYYTESEPYQDRECESKQLTYKSTADQIIRSITCTKSHQECANTFIICTQWETVCDEYTQDCRFGITNLDSETGTWTYKWSSQCQHSGCNDISSSNLNTVYGLQVEPTESKDAFAQTVYKADQEQYCYVSIIDIPTKQVCRDVTKYKNVQKSRSVTKYKTEQQCEDVTKYGEARKTRTIVEYESLWESLTGKNNYKKV